MVHLDSDAIKSNQLNAEEYMTKEEKQSVQEIVKVHHAPGKLTFVLFARLDPEAQLCSSIDQASKSC